MVKCAYCEKEISSHHHVGRDCPIEEERQAVEWDPMKCKNHLACSECYEKLKK